MNIPSQLKYTSNDEWIKIDGKIGTIGITDYAQEQLSDIVFVEVVVSVDDEVSKGDSCATVESVKAAADVYMPVSGKVIAINEDHRWFFRFPEKQVRRLAIEERKRAGRCQQNPFLAAAGSQFLVRVNVGGILVAKGVNGLEFNSFARSIGK